MLNIICTMFHVEHLVKNNIILKCSTWNILYIIIQMFHVEHFSLHS